MTIAEKVELVLIPLAAGAAWFSAPVLPASPSVGNLILICSGLLLFQSLVRDLAILARAQGRSDASAPREARCMCIESALGATGVLMGAAVLGAGMGGAVNLGAISWALTVGLVMALGFAVKDLVFEWNPWRIRRDKDHMNIIFTFKS